MSVESVLVDPPYPPLPPGLVWTDNHSAEPHIFSACALREMGGLLVNWLQILTYLSPAPLSQVSPQHPPLWKPHQHIHREAWDPPSHLLCLLGEPPEGPVLSPGCSQLYSKESDLGACFCGGGRDAAGVRGPASHMEESLLPKHRQMTNEKRWKDEEWASVSQSTGVAVDCLHVGRGGGRRKGRRNF